MVKIRWCGHNCFEITGKDVVIATDPFNGKMVGLVTPDICADIIMSSHNHGDHWHKKTAENMCNEGAEIIKWENKTFENIKGVKIKGVATAHDDNEGKSRGQNTVYVFTVDGLTLCHCGDLGHTLKDEQIKEIGKIDILLIPVGGIFTIDPKAATKVVEQLNPKLVIPMHYYHEGMASMFSALSTIDDFIKDKKNIKKIDVSEAEVTKETLPTELEYWVLKPIV
ncbi:MAG: MBL fold metallo-hydrolase [Candidatus Hodarchaeota archaeon]